MHKIDWNPQKQWSIDGCHFMFQTTRAKFRQLIEISKIPKKAHFSLDFYIFCLVTRSEQQQKMWATFYTRQRNEGKKIINNKNNITVKKKTNKCENHHKLGSSIHQTLISLWMKSFEFLDKTHGVKFTFS